MSSEDQYILVTGGAGYIGSHTVIELINNGYKVIIVDNLSNSSYDAVARIEYIVNQHILFYNINLKDTEKLDEVFKKHKIIGVIHFAALKAVGESGQIPLKYYDNNVGGTISLLNVCTENNVKTVVFSSSATVYGDVTRFDDDRYIPIPEECPNDPTNPYGKTKYIIEQILKDVHDSDPKNWKVAILRYFNPIGAHPSGLIGEDPLGIPNNLLPYLSQVAIGRREKLSVFGNDYNSKDGTPIRDYIHVVDLAKGHIAALNYLKRFEKDIKNQNGLYREWNLGTGKGSTVFEVYEAFCKAVGKELPYEVVGRRKGDVLNLTAKPDRANTELEWKAELNVEDACKDLWKWTTENPFGFEIKNYEWTKFNDLNNRLHRFVLGDFEVKFCNRGALIQSINLGDEELVCGFNDAEEYESETNPFFGTTIGRFTNRIKDSSFQLDGETFKLTSNENGNTLHSGSHGFDKQNFFGPVVKSKNGEFDIKFKLIDEDGNDGFPGKLETIVHYVIQNESNPSITIEYESKLLTKSSTIINLTNHSYFNLSNNSTIDGTDIKIYTNKVLELNSNGLPTGKIVTRENIPTKLTPETNFDDCFVVSENSQIDTRSNSLNKIFEASHPNSQTKLVISTTEPSFQFYTGDAINTHGFGKRSGFCVEPSRFVDAIHLKKYENQVILLKDDVYGAKSKMEFIKK
ncbi:GAL10 [Candida pseudojiufengensis]|uniref:GAL10 n=1 Tax=Candida pseudojiufengensis TaxID=497109 RepID=UPI002225488D|nr:GAL10 [Candida pseudojiufengensis]KAI5959576.1 GAL10 [Candida pseudojiufengensis]